MKKVSMRKLLSAMLLALVTMSLLFAVPVQAKTVKSAKKFEKAAKVTKGTTKVNSKATDSYLRFTAPKSKTYTITLSGFASKPARYNDIGYGHYCLRKRSAYGYWSYEKVKTNGGESTTMSVTTKYCWNNYVNKKTGKKVSRYLTSRSSKIWLNAGETVVIDTFFTSKQYSYKIKIK